jgi:agmatine deiminase
MSKVVRVRTLDELNIPTNDAWVRDFGPLFAWTPGPPRLAGFSPHEVSNKHTNQPQLTLHDFRFNSWGNKYEDRPLDDAVTAQLAKHLNLPIHRHNINLEGGAIDTDGRGTLLTTSTCLLHPSRRSPDTPVSREAWEQLLHDTLGINRTIWLEADLPGDDTDGHIDNAARFLSSDLVAIHPAIDPQPILAADLDILTLPTPQPRTYDYPAIGDEPARTAPLPMSYANFLFANGHLFVPTFKDPADDVALRILDDALPNHTIISIPADWLVVGQGALHCLSMQHPAQT